jgi:phosphomannomutase
MTSYIFDIDGTLTPPREAMDLDFRKYFGEWARNRKVLGDFVVFVTGSDRKKTIEQVGLPLCRLVNGCYQNCGNQLYIKNSLVKESNWRMTAHLYLDIMILLEKSPWYGRAKNNIEERVGMVNISTVGRDATPEQRKQYYQYDQKTGERKGMVRYLSIHYPKLEFSIGGEISIDVYPKGKDKSQVLQDFKGKSIFFGDRCNAGGNDYGISQKCSKYYNVVDWQDTKRIIELNYA